MFLEYLSSFFSAMQKTQQRKREREEEEEEEYGNAPAFSVNPDSLGK